jgi:hypothetical protein
MDADDELHSSKKKLGNYYSSNNFNKAGEQ